MKYALLAALMMFAIAAPLGLAAYAQHGGGEHGGCGDANGEHGSFAWVRVC